MASSESTVADVEVDATGLTCPMPLLKAKQALNRLEVGATLCVRATDPGSERDFAVFARQSGHELLSATREGDVFIYLLRKTS
ncbi:MAG: sulfurtransferase TusA family protein [Gammaproteobacteria bacterium]|nr:sulfurtransferase TusA family protein [Gammaproteobacteria bacterium]